MKKLLLILLFLPMIGFGQSLENIEKINSSNNFIKEMISENLSEYQSLVNNRGDTIITFSKFLRKELVEGDSIDVADVWVTYSTFKSPKLPKVESIARKDDTGHPSYLPCYTFYFFGKKYLTNSFIIKKQIQENCNFTNVLKKAGRMQRYFNQEELDAYRESPWEFRYWDCYDCDGKLVKISTYSEGVSIKVYID